MRACLGDLNGRNFVRRRPLLGAKEDELVSDLALEIDETAFGAQILEFLFAPPSKAARGILRAAKFAHDAIEDGLLIFVEERNLWVHESGTAKSRARL